MRHLPSSPARRMARALTRGPSTTTRAGLGHPVGGLAHLHAAHDRAPGDPTAAPCGHRAASGHRHTPRGCPPQDLQGLPRACHHLDDSLGEVGRPLLGVGQLPRPVGCRPKSCSSLAEAVHGKGVLDVPRTGAVLGPVTRSAPLTLGGRWRGMGRTRIGLRWSGWSWVLPGGRVSAPSGPRLRSGRRPGCAHRCVRAGASAPAGPSGADAGGRST